MKSFRSVSVVFLAAVVAAGMFYVPAIFNGMPASAEHEDEKRNFTATGTIASLQNNQEGRPTWITSGNWRMTVEQSTDNEIELASFKSAIRMVNIDGTAAHRHTISNFKLSGWAGDNTTITFDGTVTVVLRDGPKEDVPVNISIKNGGAVSIIMDPEFVDHFGDTPIYGTVRKMKSYLVVDDHIHGTKPKDGDSVQLAGLYRSTVNYHGNASGYLVYPEKSTGRLPAAIMIHEWWGLNQNIKNMAESLAKEGYVVLAVDLYSGQVASDFNRARELVTTVSSNPEAAKDNLLAAVDYVSSLQNVDSSRISSLGWCFGGGWSLQLALNTKQPLAATVIYYGSLVTEKETLATIKWPVLGIFGDKDASIPVDSVRQFESALDGNKITNEIYIYQGVGHAFANPSGDSYAPKEADDAWRKTLAFLKKYSQS